VEATEFNANKADKVFIFQT